MESKAMRAIKVFYCYARKDEKMRDELEKHLEVLRRSKQITAWYDRIILPGVEWRQEIDTNLNSSNLVLLLISPNFVASDYCYGVEMRRALERHKAGEAHVIPIILRPVDWQVTPIGELQVLPTGGKPITKWRDRDSAFLDVVRGVRKVIDMLLEHTSQQIPHASPIPSGIDSVASIQEKPLGTLLYLYRGHPAFNENTINSITALTWSPAGPYIASASLARKSIHVWNAFTGHKLQTCHRSYRGALKSSMFALAWSPDGTRLASASEQTVYVWDPFTGKCVLIYEGHYRLTLSVRTEYLTWPGPLITG